MHAGVTTVFILFILAFKALNSTSVIDAVYVMASYTYGPLLGLFAFGLFTRRTPTDRFVPYVAVAAPLLCYAANISAARLWDYHFGYELLLLNGALAFIGLLAMSEKQKAV